MNAVKIMLPALLVVACATPTANTETGYEKRIIGSWSCLKSESEDGMTMKLEVGLAFRSDGSVVGNGLLRVDTMEYPHAEFLLSGQGMWRVENQSLVTRVDGLNISSKQYPQLVERFWSEDIVPLHVEDSIQIIQLNQTELLLGDSPDSMQRCTRVQ